MIIINGPSTFEWRDHLRDAGGIWNAALRRWEFSGMDQETIAIWRNRPGIVVITGAEGKPVPRPQSIAHQTFTQYHRRTIDRTNIFGDDPTYFNYFADQNPISYFGFSGLNMLMGFVDHMPKDIIEDYTNDRNNPWKEHRPEWYASDDMQHALSIARNGWKEGVALADELREKMVADHAQEKRRKYSIAGGRVSVGRLLADNPKHMISRPRQSGKKVITLFLESSFSASINSEHVILRAGMVAAIADILETQGYSCEIVAVACAEDNGPAWQIVTKLKTAGERLNINDMVFALGHTAFFRRFNLAAIAFDPALIDVWETAGWPANPFTDSHQPKSNELIIKQIKHEQRFLIDDNAPLMVRAQQIWDLIIPENFPITLKEKR